MFISSAIAQIIRANSTNSFDVQQVRDMVAWLRARIEGAKILAERAGGFRWTIQPSEHQFVDLAFVGLSGIAQTITVGGDEGAMSRPDAQHGVLGPFPQD